MHKKYSLGVVLQEPFPIGMAATNRILSYASEIAKSKNVKIYIPLSTEFGSKINNKEPYGSFKGVDYEYANNTTVWPKKSNKILKIWLVIISTIKLLFNIKKDNPSTLIFYANTGVISFFQIFLIKLFCSNKLIIEESEYPKFYRRKNNYFIKKIIFSAYGMSDGMIVMTKILKNYYRKFTNKKILLLPMTVDFSRFKNITMPENFYYKNYFVYVGGNGGVERDGLRFMIKAFTIFSKKKSDYKLLIVGPISYENQQNLLNEIDHNSVIMIGPLCSKDIPYVLKNSVACVMTPCKEFTSGGFPTKLGEFLLSGKPVIVSALDSILDYLDDSNAILFKPNCIKGCVSAFEKVILPKNKSLSIAQNGYAVCDNYFNPSKYSNQLIEFLEI